jgi:hypothetical protein
VSWKRAGMHKAMIHRTGFSIAAYAVQQPRSKQPFALGGHKLGGVTLPVEVSASQAKVKMPPNHVGAFPPPFPKGCGPGQACVIGSQANVCACRRELHRGA